MSDEPIQEPACKLCQFWEPRDNAMSGSCRNAPPQVVVHGGFNGVWPTTLPEHWCGAYEPKNPPEITMKEERPVPQTL